MLQSLNTHFVANSGLTILVGSLIANLTTDPVISGSVAASHSVVLHLAFGALSAVGGILAYLGRPKTIAN